ncbi:MAG: peptidylprolyl isomerase [Dehalococcoidales bacterium]|nr:peptidylprolyl isomerase [Dehalococcoidales bacterium]
MSKKVSKPVRETTKRQVSQWQQQAKRQRLVILIGIAIVVLVVGLVGAGWYVSDYKPSQQVAVSVNGTDFKLDYFIQALAFYGGDQPDYYLYALTDQVAVAIEQNELVKLGAEKLGISFSDETIDEEVKSRDLPLTATYRDLVRSELLVSALLDEYFDGLVPTSAAQRQVMAMFLETEGQSRDIKARLEAGEDFATLAGEASLESLSKDNKGDLGWHSKDALDESLGTTIPGDYAFRSELNVLSQPLHDETKPKNVGYWLIKVLEKNTDTAQINLQVMLLGTEEEAESIKTKLAAGGDFAALAKESSQDAATKEKGGDLGWVSITDITDNPTFASVAEQEVGTVSQPLRDVSVTTDGGYWLLKVIGREDSRVLSDEDRDLLKNKDLRDWISSLFDDPGNKIENHLTDEMRRFAVEKIT